MKNLPEIFKWVYQDLLELPSEETDIYEYKSSKVPLDQLKNKISIAASAFWNSGGGIFIAGVNNDGKVDGGIPCKNGRQSIRDWVDNAIKLTEPISSYEVFLIENTGENDNIGEDKVILIIKFNESDQIPHMAYDKKYYVRVGAHSDGASHFIVEALRSLRNTTRPNLRGIMKYHPTKPKIEELVIVSINDAVALDVKLTFDPFPIAIGEHFVKDFPLEIALIDKNNPFRMEISLFGARSKAFGEEPAKLILSYKDIIGNEHRTEQFISPHKNLQPMAIGDDIFERLTKAIDKLADKL
ncbi:MAG: ATP-binding protein [Dysgonamonadaceae bacterium]|nr:ATP-binding protein [Dysgonamonadaceae bacterium]